MKESLSVFSFERDSRQSVTRSWTLTVEERNLPDSVSATALLTCE